jgi:predicted transcriptional regulator
MQTPQTTIQVSCDIKNRLDRMKMFERETYNEVIERMIEDDLELSEQTKKDIEKARKQAKEGKLISHEEVKKRLGIN